MAEEEKYDGYYSIVSSETELSDAELRNIYRGLWKIEESFKVVKSEFKARPVFLSIEEHIKAHFLICFVALVVYRILEHKLDKVYSPKTIRKSLIGYSCSQAHENYYLFDYRDHVIEALENVFKVDFSRKYLSKSEIKNTLKNK